MTASVDAPAPAPVTGRPRAVYTRIQALGLLLASGSFVFLTAAALLAGLDISEEIGFFAVLIIVPLIAAALVWRFGTWATILGVVAILGFAFMGFWTVFGLAYPASVADFMPGVLAILALGLGLGGGIAALVAKRRGRVETSATAGERKLTAVVLGIAALALIASGAATAFARSATDASGMTVTMRDFSFAEGSYTITADEPTTVVVRNADPFVHTFTVPELGVDETVLPGSEVAVDLTAAAGTYTLYCKPHSNLDEPDPEQAGMAATIVAE